MLLHEMLADLGVESLLFAGLLINRESVSPWVAWIHNISFFHAAYEALAVNELRYLQLKEHKVRAFLRGSDLRTNRTQLLVWCGS